ncbi:hypothetical protein [Curvibacter cyanobacteriorum]|nr:hypothetical protein [Curvibacter sp. HBC61]
MDIHLLSNVLNKMASKHYLATGQECLELLSLSKYLQVYSACRPQAMVPLSSEMMLFRSYLALLNRYHEQSIQLAERIDADYLEFDLPAGLCSHVMRLLMQTSLMDVSELRQVVVKLAAAGLCLELVFEAIPDQCTRGDGLAAEGVMAQLVDELASVAPGFWRIKATSRGVSIIWWPSGGTTAR